MDYNKNSINNYANSINNYANSINNYANSINNYANSINNYTGSVDDHSNSTDYNSDPINNNIWSYYHYRSYFITTSFRLFNPSSYNIISCNNYNNKNARYNDKLCSSYYI